VRQKNPHVASAASVYNALTLTDAILAADQIARPKIVEIVSSFPEGACLPANEHLSLQVADKRFGWYMQSHHGDGRIDVNCKAPRGVAEILVASNPLLYHVPQYFGHLGWIGIYLDIEEIPWDEVRDVLFEAYKLSVPKKLLKAHNFV